MNSFFKTFWAALLAFIAANLILSLIAFFFFAMMVAAIGVGENKASVEHDSVLRITLEDPITDSPVDSPFASFDFTNMKNHKPVSIMQALDAIESAAVDNRIKGIYLRLGDMSINTANMEELRAALVKFRSSGKFVVSYNETYSQAQYYLASAADSVFMNPMGGMEWHGMAAQVMFYKGLLDKLGVEAQVIRHGSFKSAVEPFILDKMSPENALQMNTLIGSVWGNIVSDVASTRKIDSLKLQQYASSLDVYSPQKAVELGFVDRLLYADQMKHTLNGLLSNDYDANPTFVDLPDYVSATTSVKEVSKNRIEIIYADGEIVDGNSSRGNVGGNTLAAKIAKAREDKRVKAVVLRVNSPGGSALASEVIWREMELLKAEKPVVVSMSGVAASGGYYIASPADIILADRTTITGSIGVFGLMFNVGDGLRDKLGITVDVARTNPSADIGTPYRKATDVEKAYMMHSIEAIYSTFVGHVAAGRNLTTTRVDSIGGGRVWAGTDAKRIGLIDGFGGIKDAIELAADRAGVAKDYTVHEAVDVKSPFMAFTDAFADMRTAKIKAEMGDMYLYYQNIQNILSQQGVQARMPYVIEMK